ncbi:MAG: hypothetical protein WAJ96_14040 [Candidatus Acidiferrum sp.]
MFLPKKRMRVFARNSQRGILFALALLSFVLAGAVAAQNAEKLPTAGEVLARYVEVTGGSAALLRYKSMTIHGRFEVLSRKIEREGVLYTKDGKALQKILLPNGKENASGYDGQIAWNLDPDGKVDIAKPDVAPSAARDADMYYHLHVMKYFKSMEVVGVKEFNGRACYHLKGVNNWGKTNEQFYDKENGLLVGYAFNTAWRGGDGDATETFEDYKDFGGVRMPTKNTHSEGGSVSIFTITSVTYDDVSDDVFALPEAVKAALAAGKTGGK